MNSTYLHSTTVDVKIQLDNTNRFLYMKSIVVESGVLLQHLQYLKEMTLTKSRSASWRRQSIQAIRLLIDYTAANHSVFENPKEMFKAFRDRMYNGTVAEDGTDDTNLRWSSKSDSSGNRIINHITDYSDWLYKESGGDSALLNPKRDATKTERMLNLAAFNHKNNNAFLGHTVSEDVKEQYVNEAREVGLNKTTQPDYDPSKAFSENRIWELLSIGFARKGVPASAPPYERYNLANVLITMLLHFGGLRTSEPFHIYIDDIIPNFGLEQIRVYHPFQGLAPDWFRTKTQQPNANRQRFLLQQYQLKPRWKHHNSTYAAGWKKPVVNHKGNYFNVFLFGAKDIQKTFLELFNMYITHQRVEPLDVREHRFLFTNKNGDPLSMDSFKKAHKSAVKKIGMIPLLDHGGSPHSHRHSYGTRLHDCGIDSFIIKQCMHHASIEAQEIYKTPNLKKINKALVEGTLLLEDQTQPLALHLNP